MFLLATIMSKPMNLEEASRLFFELEDDELSEKLSEDESSEDEPDSGAEDVEEEDVVDAGDEMHRPMYPEPEGRGFVDRIEL